VLSTNSFTQSDVFCGFRSDDESVSTKSLRLEFNREINMLYKSSHENLVKLLGVSSTNSKMLPDYLLTEYLEWVSYPQF